MDDPFNRNNTAVQARTKAQNRANVLQMKLIGQGHQTGLTANLLKLFEPRPPLEYKPPPEKRKCPPLSGIAQFVSKFAEPGDPEYAPPVVLGETPVQRRARIRDLRLEEGARKAAEELEKYDPNKDPNVTGDPYKTLFVARLNYETTEQRLKREFETYGPIKRVRLVMDKETNKPRGYAFIEYMHTRDMKTAYKQADGKKVDSRRVLVDVERGRTVPNWRPRRLGGGLGTTRVGGEDLNQKHSGREQQHIASGHTRSEEPRARDDRDREKSRERAREKTRERDRSRERSPERLRDRNAREDKHHHHRDKDRSKERERDKGKERERGRERDHARGRDKERERGRDHHRVKERDRPRDRDRERERDYDRSSHERDRGYSLDRDAEYDYLESKHGSEKSSARERDLEPGEHDYEQEWYDDSGKHGQRDGYDQLHSRQPENNLTALEHESSRSKRHESEYYDDTHYGKVRHDDYTHYRHTDPEPHEEGEAVGDDYAYHRSERSLSREYES